MNDDRLVDALENARDRLERIFLSRDPEVMTQEAYFGLGELDALLDARLVGDEGAD